MVYLSFTVTRVQISFSLVLELLHASRDDPLRVGIVIVWIVIVGAACRDQIFWGSFKRDCVVF